MKEQFCNYNQSLALKELGFEKECLAFYLTMDFPELIINGEDGEYFSGMSNEVKAPLYQQTFDYLRKEHHLYAIIIPTVNMYWTYKITTVIEDLVEIPPYKEVNLNDYSTYEEARDICLNIMLNMIKDKRDII